MGDGSNDYRAAERRLLDAIRARAICDFSDRTHISTTEMASWGPERTIRATLLRRLLTAEGADYAKHGIQLRGAAIDGVLDLSDMNVMPLELTQCRIATIEASRTHFTGDARFDGTTFTAGAQFGSATFSGDAGFAVATVSGQAWFKDATFTSKAWFLSATFAGDAQFEGATFNDTAWFDMATFGGEATFLEATFSHNVLFNGATFSDEVWFAGATFSGEAMFEGATFGDLACFASATFSHSALFNGAIADVYDLSRAQFHTMDPGPWIARRVTLTGAVFHLQARVAVAAVEKRDCRRLQAREGLHLIGRGGVVDLEDAEFLRRSILAHSASEPSVPERDDPGERPEGFYGLTPAEQEQWAGRDIAFQLAQELAAELGHEKMQQTQVGSLRRATASDLALSEVGLEDCAFAGAHGLDKLRIDATCSFQRPPTWPSHTWRPFTSRRVIFEEEQWRRTHTRAWAVGAPGVAPPAPDDPGPSPDSPELLDETMWPQDLFTATPRVPTALEIAGTYRDLRKGLEDAKDEPGAADFYYGEMEMRRLAARGSRHQRNDNGSRAKGRRPSWTERRLLDAYWAVSGYGLRAWRAVTALTILLVGCAALFTLPVFAHLSTPPQQVASVNLRTGAIQYAPIIQPSGKPGTTAAVPFGTSLKFTSTESLTLIRASGTPLLETTSAGTVLDIAVRLLAPLLLGLALLAVRGRIKR
jgi:hypothetical protein